MIDRGDLRCQPFALPFTCSRFQVTDMKVNWHLMSVFKARRALLPFAADRPRAAAAGSGQRSGTKTEHVSQVGSALHLAAVQSSAEAANPRALSVQTRLALSRR
ncbi:hypothetical protein SKAU_G00114440 [Synaphobranchus kaupii]|uniref:Uncharacterized protein n=1 Tax=Synaphobranchus kaupii TaxID=118154 RepID=A0A9Q1J8N7_SYNKA|nr:hypothetical protein SKAU_G00114440 [Synaphobranchus kaupii]